MVLAQYQVLFLEFCGFIWQAQFIDWLVLILNQLSWNSRHASVFPLKEKLLIRSESSSVSFLSFPSWLLGNSGWEREREIERGFSGIYLIQTKNNLWEIPWHVPNIIRLIIKGVRHSSPEKVWDSRLSGTPLVFSSSHNKTLTFDLMEMWGGGTTLPIQFFIKKEHTPIRNKSIYTAIVY